MTDLFNERQYARLWRSGSCVHTRHGVAANRTLGVTVHNPRPTNEGQAELTNTREPHPRLWFARGEKGVLPFPIRSAIESI